MKVLLLGANARCLAEALRELRDEPLFCEERLNPESPVLRQADAVVSYGYRYVLPADVLEAMPPAALRMNLHISLLPWNKGADPNLWSFLEDTPKGVTIHVMEAGLDAGAILAQKRVDPAPDDTLRTSYDRLTRSIEALFHESWPALRAGLITPAPQTGEGTYHSAHDKERFAHLLSQGWDTPVAGLRGAAVRADG